MIELVGSLESLPIRIGSIHDDSEAFRLFESALRSAEYLHMRSAIACRFFGIGRPDPPPVVTAGAVVDFDRGGRFRLVDPSAVTPDDGGVRGSALAAARVAGVAGATPSPERLLTR